MALVSGSWRCSRSKSSTTSSSAQRETAWPLIRRDLDLTLVIGLVAERQGLGAAMWLLLAGPVGLLLLRPRR